MKRLLVCVFLVSVATQAQESIKFKTETIEFIKLTGAGSTFDDAISQIGFKVTEANKEAYTKETTATLEGLYDKIANLYMEEFTQTEIKKLATKQLNLTQKAMMFGQSWGMEIAQIAQKHN